MSTAPRSVLALVVSRIGDTLLCTPALRALKETWPDCQLTVMAHPGRLPILVGLPWIDVLLPWHPWRRWSTLLPGAARFDLAFVFHPDRRQLDFARRSAVRVVTETIPGVAASDRLLLPALPAEPMVAVEQRLRLVRAAGADSTDQRLAYDVSAEERLAAQARLVAIGFAGHHPLVALQLKSFPTKAHRDWPAESFAGLVGGLAERYPDARFVITGDAQSAADALRLGARFSGRVASLAGQCGLRETAAILGEADLYVGVDTGPTHLAGALGIPMVALYHAAYPGRYLAPRQHPRCSVIEHPMTGCAGAAQADMAAISVEKVFEAAVVSLQAQMDNR